MRNLYLKNIRVYIQEASRKAIWKILSYILIRLNVIKKLHILTLVLENLRVRYMFRMKNLKNFMALQLTEAEYQFVKKTLNTLLPEAKLYVFGSRSTGTAKQYSDLDLLIDSDKELPLSLLSELREIFTESNLPFKVDIVDKHRITEEFLEKIKKDWILL